MTNADWRNAKTRIARTTFRLSFWFLIIAIDNQKNFKIPCWES